MVRANDNSAMDAEDEVRLYEDGWKDRYFRIIVDKRNLKMAFLVKNVDQNLKDKIRRECG